MRVASIALIRGGGGPRFHGVSQAVFFKGESRRGEENRAPSRSILGHADGHPTFLVLLDAHATPRLDNLLDLLLIDDELARWQALRLDQLTAGAHAVAAMTVVVMVPVDAQEVALRLELCDLHVDVPVGAVAVIDQRERPDGNLVASLPVRMVGVDYDRPTTRCRGSGGRMAAAASRSPCG